MMRRDLLLGLLSTEYMKNIISELSVACGDATRTLDNLLLADQIESNSVELDLRSVPIRALLNDITAPFIDQVSLELILKYS